MAINEIIIIIILSKCDFKISAELSREIFFLNGNLVDPVQIFRGQGIIRFLFDAMDPFCFLFVVTEPFGSISSLLTIWLDSRSIELSCSIFRSDKFGSIFTFD